MDCGSHDESPQLDTEIPERHHSASAALFRPHQGAQHRHPHRRRRISVLSHARSGGAAHHDSGAAGAAGSRTPKPWRSPVAVGHRRPPSAAVLPAADARDRRGTHARGDRQSAPSDSASNTRHFKPCWCASISSRESITWTNAMASPGPTRSCAIRSGASSRKTLALPQVTALYHSQFALIRPRPRPYSRPTAFTAPRSISASTMAS